MRQKFMAPDPQEPAQVLHTVLIIKFLCHPLHGLDATNVLHNNSHQHHFDFIYAGLAGI